ncbi:hypothetical protein N8083_00140 [Candidatus Pacebacteria bacterium]|nr:hypothetical protein [Candidatus Paceibacterota bacterium]
MLQKITQYTTEKLGVNADYVFKGGSWLTVNTAISAVSAILLAMILGNILSLEVYGTYKYLISVLALIGACLLNGFKTIIPQTIAKGGIDFFTVASRMYFKWSFVATILSFIGAVHYFSQSNIVLAIGMMCIGIFLPFYYTFNLYGTYPIGTANFKLQAKQNLAYVLCTTTAVVLAALFTSDALSILIALLISSTGISGIFYFATRKKIQQTREVYEKETKYGIQLSFIMMFGKISETLNNIAVFHFLGATQLAIYAFALAIPKQLRISQKILALLALPSFSRRTLSELRVAMFKKLCIAYSFVVVLIVSYWISAPIIFTYLFPQYLQAIPYSQFLSLMLLTIPTSMLRQTLSSHMQKKRLYFYEITVPIVRITTLITLVQMYALWGAVASFLTVAAYQTIVLFIAFFTIKPDKF